MSAIFLTNVIFQKRKPFYIFDVLNFSAEYDIISLAYSNCDPRVIERMQNLFRESGLEQASCPEDLGIDSSVVEDFIKECQQKDYNFKNIIIGRYGKIGVKCSKKPYGFSFRYSSFSSSKPLVALAIGFAINEGLLRLDTTIDEVFPDRFSERELEKIEGITVEHLLTMTAGKAINVLSSKEKRDWLDIFVSGRTIAPPGEKFHYISEYTYVLGRMLTEVTGLTISDYLNPRLFEPLGIEKPFWETDREGYEAAAWGLFWSADDMAKIAQLFLNHGVWDSVQVVDREWMDTMVSPLVSDLTGAYAKDLGFGYQIWANYEGTYYRFEGFFGQYIFIYPKHDAFVVMQSGDSKQFDIFPLVDKYFPAAFYHENAIEISDEKKAHFEKFLENISYDILESGPRNLATEEYLNGKCFKMIKRRYLTMQSVPASFVFVKQPGKMDDISFEFEESFAVMKWTEKNYGENELVISFDGKTRYSALNLGQNLTHAAAYGRWTPDGKLKVQVILIETPEVKNMVFTFGKKSMKMKLKVKTTLNNMIVFKLLFMGLKSRFLANILGVLGNFVGNLYFYPPINLGRLKKKKESNEN